MGLRMRSIVFVLILITLITLFSGVASGQDGSKRNLIIPGIWQTPEDQAKNQKYALDLGADYVRAYPCWSMLKFNIQDLEAVKQATPQKKGGYLTTEKLVKTETPGILNDDVDVKITEPSTGFQVKYTKTNRNGLKDELLNHGDQYGTIYAHSGGARTAVTALLYQDVTADKLVLISPARGVISDDEYRQELQRLLDLKKVKEIVVYQSPLDKPFAGKGTDIPIPETDVNINLFGKEIDIFNIPKADIDINIWQGNFKNGDIDSSSFRIERVEDTLLKGKNGNEAHVAMWNTVIKKEIESIKQGQAQSSETTPFAAVDMLSVNTPQSNNVVGLEPNPTDTSKSSSMGTTQTTSPSISTKFPVGSKVEVTTALGLHVRSVPGDLTNDPTIPLEAKGSRGTIQKGRVYANGFWWVEMRYDDGKIGWSAEDWLKLAPTKGEVVSQPEFVSGGNKQPVTQTTELALGNGQLSVTKPVDLPSPSSVGPLPGQVKVDISVIDQQSLDAVPGAQVTALDGNGVSVTVRWTSDGQAFAYGAPGDWKIISSAPGYGKSTAYVPAQTSTRADATLTKGGNSDQSATHQVVEPSSTSVGPLPGQVKVAISVKDQWSLDAIPGAQVTAIDGNGVSVSVTWTSDGQAFAYGAPGDWKITTSAQGYVKSTAYLPAQTSTRSDATLTKGENSDQPATPQLVEPSSTSVGPLAGQVKVAISVKDQWSLDAIPGAQVTAIDGNGVSVPVTWTSDGQAFAYGAPGDWKIISSAPGYGKSTAYLPAQTSTRSDATLTRGESSNQVSTVSSPSVDLQSVTQPVDQQPAILPTEPGFGDNSLQSDPLSVTQPVDQQPAILPTEPGFGDNSLQSDPLIVIQPVDQRPVILPTEPGFGDNSQQSDPLIVIQPVDQRPVILPMEPGFGDNSLQSDPLIVIQPVDQRPVILPTEPGFGENQLQSDPLSVIHPVDQQPVILPTEPGFGENQQQSDPQSVIQPVDQQPVILPTESGFGDSQQQSDPQSVIQPVDQQPDTQPTESVAGNNQQQLNQTPVEQGAQIAPPVTQQNVSSDQPASA